MKLRAVAIFISLLFTAYVLVTVGVPEITGLYQDMNDPEFYIFFKDDGTYVDTTYCFPRAYSVKDDVLYIEDLLRRQLEVELKPSIGRHLYLELNGERRVLKAAEAVPQFNYAENSVQGTPYEKYSLFAQHPGSLEFHPHSSWVFEYNGDTRLGKYFRLNDQYTLLLEQGDSEELHLLAHSGPFLAFGEMTSDIRSEPIMYNTLSVRGYSLDGVAYDNTGLLVDFQPDGIANVSSPDGEAVAKFIYFTDQDGLIYLTDMSSAGVHLSLYMNPKDSKIFRFVFESDSWFHFLTGGAEEGH